MYDLVFWQAFEARDTRHTDTVIGTAGARQRRTSDGEVTAVSALSSHTPLCANLDRCDCCRCWMPTLALIVRDPFCSSLGRQGC